MDPHVAVLLLDTPIAGLAEIYGDFGDNVITLLQKSKRKYVKYQVAFEFAEQENIEEKVEKCVEVFSILTSGIKSGQIKGVILSGSRTDSFIEGHPWVQLLDKFIQTTLFNTPNFPVIGLCFGHQILAKNLGCKVNRNSTEKGWEAGTVTISLNKSIVDIPMSPFRSALVTESGEFLEHINLVEFHRDVVYGMPPTSSHALVSNTNFQNIGHTPKCSIQGYITESGPLKILTFQGHPEFSTPESLKLLEILAHDKKIDQAFFERSKYNTTNLENQGHIIGKVITQFIESHIQF